VSSKRNQPRDIIRAKLTEQHLSMKDASLAIGKNHAYLQQYFERGAPSELPRDTRERLARTLGVAAHDLVELSAPYAATAKQTATFVRPFRPGTDLIPVLGLAEGGEEGWSIWNGDTVAYVERPPSLRGATKAYALHVIGSSMEPRYYANETIHAHPSKAITVGAFVVLQIRATEEGVPPRALVKRLVKRLSSKVVLEQFNPPRTFEIATKDIVSMHRIVSSAE